MAAAASGGRRGAITALIVHGSMRPTVEDALARTLLTITFDGAEQPQVAVPAGRLLRVGPGYQRLRVVDQQGPERRLDGRVLVHAVPQVGAGPPDEFIASSRSQVRRRWRIDPAQPPEGPLYFHARWRYQDDLQTKKADGTLDWPALRVSGAPGRFVGLLLNVYNPTPAWWGEGDEKIYVDGESFPSTFGTGTEDYFGYAWGDNHPYMNPFHAQTRCDGPGTKGNTSNIRYQILDSVPFHKSLGFDIEVWHWEAGEDPVRDRRLLLRRARREDRARRPRPVGPQGPSQAADQARAGRHRGRGPEGQGEDGRRRAQPGHDSPSAMPGRRAHQLWWVVHEPNAKLDLELPVKAAGTYALSAAFTKAGDYGTVQLALDGEPLGKPIDLYEPAPAVIHTGDVLLGTATLDAGPHTLTITITGKNAKSTNYLVGMDWIKLAPAPTRPQP